MAKRTPEQLHADIAVPQAIKKWHAYINRKLDELSNSYPPSERFTWTSSALEAKAQRGNPNAATPFLTAAANAAGIDKSALADIISANEESFSAASGALVGSRIAGDAQIRATTNQEELDVVLNNLGI